MRLALNNTTEIFQQAMDVILASVKRKCAIVYIDDIIIF